MARADLNVSLGLAIDQFQAGIKAAQKSMKRMAREFDRIGSDLTNAVTLPVLAIGGAGIKAAADMEKLRLALASALGPTGDVAAELERLQTVAKAPGLGFEQAIRGSVRLQAVGFSADEARSALSSFGNAIALAGGAASDLDGVTLALTQIESKGKISAEEINQLAERVPQVRQAIENAFGTSDSEALQKLNIDTKTFINSTTAELAKLPPAAGGIANSFENFATTAKLAFAELGTAINEAVGLEAAMDTIIAAIDGAVGAFRSLDIGTQRAILAFAGVVAAAGPLLKAISAMQFALANLLSPTGLIIAAIAALAAGFVLAFNKSEKFRGIVFGVGEVLKEVGRIAVETFRGIVETFNAFREGNIQEGFERIKNALSAANPITAATTQGARLAAAFARGYTDGLESEKIDVQRILNPAAVNFNQPTSPTLPAGPILPAAPPLEQYSAFEQVQRQLSKSLAAVAESAYFARDGVVELERTLISGLQPIAETQERFKPFLGSLENVDIRTREFADAISGGLNQAFVGLFDNLDGDPLASFRSALEKTVKSLAAAVATSAVLALLFTVITGGTGKAFTALKGGAGSLFGGFLKKFVPGLAEGGIVPPGFPNDSFPARLSSGEAVIPLSKLNQFSGGGQIQGGEITIDGDKLRIVLERAERNSLRTNR